MCMILKGKCPHVGGESRKRRCATVRATNEITKTLAFLAKTRRDDILAPESATGGAV